MGAVKAAAIAVQIFGTIKGNFHQKVSNTATFQGRLVVTGRDVVLLGVLVLLING